ncbi:MAG TPA: CvpA family protein, partial [Phycisphaerae bacterium]|nr:CvpA family protein [Phycisphaerae bacterium]
MIFNVLVFLLIAMITMYLATQGMVSSLIALATSTFSSILAMALTEPLSGVVGSFRPDYARGVTFLLLFLFAFSGTRIAADMIVKNNIKLSLWVNRLSGGFFGFFVALVVMGSIVVGIEMLPVPTTLLGFERFPGARLTSTLDADGKVVYGEATRQRNSVWFAPDSFVLGIWNLTSGRALNGNASWYAVHPDFTMENYGYRYPVFNISDRTAPKNLVKVSDVWMAAEPKDYQGRGIPTQTGKRVVVVRVEVQKGDKEPNMTADNDGYLRVSAAQVRLVAADEKKSRFHQYYPIGDLFQGRQFEPLTLDSGFIVDDYSTKGIAIEEWVFAIAEDESPSLFEFKTARTDAEDLSPMVKDKVSQPLRVADYPARAYYKNLCTVTVTFDPGEKGKLVAGRVYVLKPDGKIGDIHNSHTKANDAVTTIIENINNSSNGWSNPPKPGVPPLFAFTTAIRNNNNPINAPLTDTVPWNLVLPLYLLANTSPDPRTNLNTLPAYMKDTIEPLWNGAKSGSLVSAVADADATSVAKIGRIAPTAHTVVITMLTDTGFYV